ncbi:hypothetical protein [Bacillus sp. UNC41MFS5]|uniref:hypothetical protein n=1 Tax=Bacillus sp. UNC41MFS5 TaxID=1449046 RepID=UPI00047A42AC|nr:hypothetical protein [Bacillus sp. UNC41MFS5]
MSKNRNAKSAKCFLKKPWLLRIYPLPSGIIDDNNNPIYLTTLASSKIANYYKQLVIFINTFIVFFFKIIQREKNALVL